MDVDEDDDFYAPEDSGPESSEQPSKAEEKAETTAQAEDGDLEEGEEEDEKEEEEEEEEDDNSDIDIITERKDGSKPAQPSQPRYNDIRNIPQRTGSSDVVTKAPVAKKEASKATQQVSGKDLPGVATSKIDVNGKPVYEPAGKPITQVNIDLDLAENDKPWRRPGTDISDYFNYGFDEFTWALYASKQESLRSEFSADKIALNNKKMFEDMSMMMGMGGMPGMIPGAGMEGGMPPEMQAMMQQMMAQGGDPSQMDPSAMFAAMQGVQGGGAATGAQGGGQGFGGQGGFGQGQNQFGFDGGNRGGGNFGRGRGGNRRGQW